MPGSVHKAGNNTWITTWGKRKFHHVGAGAERRAKAQLRLLQGIKHGWRPTYRRNR